MERITGLYVMSFKDFLLESQQINLAMKAYKSLPKDVQYIIDSWESMNWNDGDLVKSFKNKDKNYDEIVQTFKPVKDYLKKQYPGGIKLYRGVGKNDEEWIKRKVLVSWTDDKKVAEYFSGLRGYQNSKKTLLKKIYTDQELKDVYEKLKNVGFVKHERKIYKNTKKTIDYFGKKRTIINIYSLDKTFITDDLLEDFLEGIIEDNEWNKKENEKILSRGQVIEKVISIDDIFWITNSLKSKEYIVINKNQY